MTSMQSPVSDMMVTVKSREVQRGLAAEMAGRTEQARKHLLAAAHLELVLAADYDEVGDVELSRRSRISAATCLWRAGDTGSAQAIFNELSQADPGRASEIQAVVDELNAKESRETSS